MGDGGLWGRHVSIMEIYEPYFDTESGTYHGPDGERFERVTDILQGELESYRGYPESAAQRGTAVHLACQYDDNNDLEEKSLADNIRGYVDAYRKAKKECNIKILQNEIMRYHNIYKYAGRMDAIVEFNGIKTVMDIKTGNPLTWHKWQLAAYLGLIQQEAPDIRGRLNLYLKSGGKYSIVERTSKQDFLEFLALLGAYMVKKNNGYIKEKRRESDE